jgi:mannose-6-phosphate isomerase class I
LVESSYDTAPTIKISGHDGEAWQGYAAIATQIRDRMQGEDRYVIVVETYPTVRDEEIIYGLEQVLSPASVVCAKEAALSSEVINEMAHRYLTDDRVFGHMTPFHVEDLFDADGIRNLKQKVDSVHEGIVLVVGFGASLITDGDVLIYADLSRWEIQQRYRSHEFGNWNINNHDEDILRKYKRGYFFEWRVADRLKRRLLEKIDFYLDTHVADEPKMITGTALLEGLCQASEHPFRLVPYFDPGVWGGHWLEQHIDLPPQSNPYAWGFDGVPEENSLYFMFGEVRIELPAINLVFYRPKQLLGERVYARFGAEFPIRFDFLDTIGGQHLSLQVHPTTDYIQQTFGMHYTQDESYYILDAGEDATVYLGLKDGIHPESMINDLARAADGEISFPADAYVNTFPAKKHDHFLIPAGTIHCSGRNSMVLEISATPYIFTFKLWDWDRVGLDGLPRPVHLSHGFKNIQWDRTTEWVRDELVGRVETLQEGAGWIEERTGLHDFQFIETRRHWFSKPVEHETFGSVNVLNLVEGQEATVESPTNDFEPFVVHYAETFIIPATVQSYVIRPSGPSTGQTIGTIKAFVRQ